MPRGAMMCLNRTGTASHQEGGLTLVQDSTLRRCFSIQTPSSCVDSETLQRPLEKDQLEYTVARWLNNLNNICTIHDDSKISRRICFCYDPLNTMVGQY